MPFVKKILAINGQCSTFVCHKRARQLAEFVGEMLRTRQHALIFPPLSGHAMVSSVAACCVPPTVHALYYALSIGMTQQFFVFLVPGDLDFDL